MISLNFAEPFAEESIHYILGVLNEVEPENPLRVYMSSTGGDMKYIHLLKKEFEEKKVSLVWNGNNSGSALIAFVISQVEKEVLPCSSGGYSRPFISANVSPTMEKIYYPPSAQRTMHEVNEQFARWFENKYLDLTAKQIKSLDNGESIYFNTDDIRKILNIKLEEN